MLEVDRQTDIRTVASYPGHAKVRGLNCNQQMTMNIVAVCLWIMKGDINVLIVAVVYAMFNKAQRTN